MGKHIEYDDFGTGEGEFYDLDFDGKLDVFETALMLVDQDEQCKRLFRYDPAESEDPDELYDPDLVDDIDDPDLWDTMVGDDFGSGFVLNKDKKFSAEVDPNRPFSRGRAYDVHRYDEEKPEEKPAPDYRFSNGRSYDPHRYDD